MHTLHHSLSSCKTQVMAHTSGPFFHTSQPHLSHCPYNPALHPAHPSTLPSISHMIHITCILIPHFGTRLSGSFPVLPFQRISPLNKCTNKFMPTIMDTYMHACTLSGYHWSIPHPSRSIPVTPFPRILTTLMHRCTYAHMPQHDICTSSHFSPHCPCLAINHAPLPE